MLNLSRTSSLLGYITNKMIQWAFAMRCHLQSTIIRMKASKNAAPRGFLSSPWGERVRSEHRGSPWLRDSLPVWRSSYIVAGKESVCGCRRWRRMPGRGWAGVSLNTCLRGGQRYVTKTLFSRSQLQVLMTSRSSFWTRLLSTSGDISLRALPSRNLMLMAKDGKWKCKISILETNHL